MYRFSRSCPLDTELADHPAGEVVVEHTTVVCWSQLRLRGYRVPFGWVGQVYSTVIHMGDLSIEQGYEYILQERDYRSSPKAPAV